MLDDFSLGMSLSVNEDLGGRLEFLALRGILLNILPKVTKMNLI